MRAGVACPAEEFGRRVKAVDAQGVDVLVRRERRGQVGPPCVEEAVGDDAEPRGPIAHLHNIAGHGRLEVRLGDPLVVDNLRVVRLDCQRLVTLQLVNQQVVDLVLTPRGVWPVRVDIGSPVVHTCHELEPLRVQLRAWNTKLVLQLPHGGVLDAHVRSLPDVIRRVELGGAHAVQRVAATSVRPDQREGDLLAGALLQEQPTRGIEEHNRKGPVQYSSGLPRQKLVAIVLVVMSDNIVHVVDCDALVLQHEVVLRHPHRAPHLAVGAGRHRVLVCGAAAPSATRAGPPEER
mmetsp:Transcript_126743/g.354883  ORF Transcript_126743/g.354883 Transcript_126743/m.354883 type:complete len:292 (-) Transcript_126743:45-920(-)